MTGLSDHFAFESWWGWNKFSAGRCDEYCNESGISISTVARVNLFVKRGFHFFAGPAINYRKYSKYEIYSSEKVPGSSPVFGERVRTELGYKWNAGENFLIGLDFLSVLYRPAIFIKPKTTYDDGITEEQKVEGKADAEDSITVDRGRVGLAELKLGLIW